MLSMSLKGIAMKTMVVVAAAGLLASCVTRADIEEIKQQQKDILAKLDKVGTGGPQAPQQPRGPDPSKTYAFPIGESPVKGAKDAWVTIVEVSDFQCPYCKRVGETLKEIETKYGSDVRFVFKHNALPFHKRAKPAAAASMCANEQGKFWEMHDALFEGQRELEDNHFETYAQKIGLNMGKWKECYTANKYDSAIDADQRLANQLGARGTPAFFINGRFLSGAQPFASFQAVIDQELKKAKESGIPKGEYYTKAIIEKGAKSL
jgi:protein-disulfide isomerase